MKLAALILSCLALGTAAGFAVPRRRPPELPDLAPGLSSPGKAAVPQGDPAPAPADDVEIIRRALEHELEALRKNPATFTSEEKSARAAELTAGMARLEKAGKTDDLIAAMHALAALGKEGFAGAFQALEAIDHLTEFYGRDRFLDACDGAVLRLAMWAIGNPANAPRDSRAVCAEILARHFDDDLDAGPLILKALATEQDEEVRLILAKTLPYVLPLAATPVLATAGFDEASTGKAALALARGIAFNHWPEAQRDSTLAWLATSADPAVAGAAAAARIALHPPVSGVLVERVGTKSATATAGLKPGDIITGVDGEPLRDIEDLERAMSFAANCVLRVRRGEQEIDLGISASAYDRQVEGIYVAPR
jgi:hypothetical protein